MTDTSASPEAPAVVIYVKVTLIADHFCCAHTQFQKMDEQVNIIHLVVIVQFITIHSFIEIEQIKHERNLKEA